MELDSMLGVSGAVRVRAGSALHRRLERLVRAGVLVRLLPCTYVRAETAGHPAARAAAVCAYDPAAVLIAHSAAALHLREHQWPPVVTFTSPRRWKVTRPWLSPSRGAMAPEHVHPLPMAHVDRATAALQVATTDGPRIVDDGLREREFTAAGLQRALAALAGTPGNAARRSIVEGSLAHPWSQGERELHALLKAARIRGWRGNLATRAGGRRYVLDVAFPVARIVIEVDGWSHHGDRAAFEADRARHNDLSGAGWTVLHVTPAMIDREPERVIAWVRSVLTRAS